MTTERGAGLTVDQLMLLRRGCAPGCIVPPRDATARQLWNRSLVSIAPGNDQWRVDTLPAGRAALIREKGE